MITTPENTPEFAQICVHGTIRRGARRIGLQSRTGLGTVCTDCGFPYINFPSSLLQVHVRLALFQHVHHTGKCPKFAQICVNGTIRRGANRLVLQPRTGLGTVCIDCRFPYFNSPSSLLHVHVHFALVQHCTTPENTTEFAQICENGTILRGAKRLGLQSRTGLVTVCTDCGFSFFCSPSSLFHVHVHLALVQHLHHAGKYPRICAN